MSCGQLAASLQAFRDLKVHTSIGFSHDKCKILTYFVCDRISHISFLIINVKY